MLGIGAEMWHAGQDREGAERRCGRAEPVLATPKQGGLPSRKATLQRPPTVSAVTLATPAARTGKQHTHRKSARISDSTSPRHTRGVTDAALTLLRVQAEAAAAVAAAMKRSHHAGKVSGAYAPECPTAQHALWLALSPGVRLLLSPVPLRAADRCCATAAVAVSCRSASHVQGMHS